MQHFTPETFGLGSYATPNSGHLGIYNNVAQARSVMYIFTPRRFSLQVKRPLLYTLNDMALEKLATGFTHVVTDHDQTLLTQLIKSPETYNLVLPSTEGIPIDMGSMSNNYTFILVIRDIPFRTNDPLAGLRRPVSDTLTYYYGYFTQEPLNPLDFGGGRSLNPKAGCIITHQTRVNDLKAFGPMGMTQRINVACDEDVVIPTALAHVARSNGNDLHIMTPDELFGASSQYRAGRGGVNIKHNSTALGMLNANVTIDSSLHNPRDNFAFLVKQTADMLERSVSDNITSSIGGTRASDDTMRMLLQDGLTQRSGMSSLAGLDVNTYYTLQQIDQRFGPETVLVEQPHATMYGVADQGATSPSTVFSSLFSSMLPGILAKNALATISFNYASYNRQIEWLHVEGLMPNMENDDLMRRAHSVKVELESSIFHMMKEARGDFEVSTMSTSGGISNCLIRFMDDFRPETAPFETPTLLGGYNTNLVGTERDKLHNAQEIAAIAAAAMNSDVITTSSNMEYERQFLGGMGSQGLNIGTSNQTVSSGGW